MEPPSTAMNMLEKRLVHGLQAHAVRGFLQVSIGNHYQQMRPRTNQQVTKQFVGMPNHHDLYGTWVYSTSGQLPLILADTVLDVLISH